MTARPTPGAGPKRARKARPPAPDFHRRFGLEVDASGSRTWFVNRLRNLLFHSQALAAKTPTFDPDSLCFPLALHLGVPYDSHTISLALLTGDTSGLSAIVPRDFLGLLRALEFLAAEFPEPQRSSLSSWIGEAIEVAPGALEVRWDGTNFWPATAPGLDETIGEYPLVWLRAEGLDGVATPYGRALRSLVESPAEPAAARNAVRDAYEALEAAARAVLGNRRDLSGNREKLASTLDLAAPLRSALPDYVTWGSQYRHPTSPEIARDPTSGDAEAFVLLTGVLLLRVIRHLQRNPPSGA